LSRIPQLVRAGKYNQVPAELMKYDRTGGVVSPSLVARRRAEVALWNK